MGAHNHNSPGKKVEELRRDQAFSLKCKGRYTIHYTELDHAHVQYCVFLEMASARIGERFRLDLGYYTRYNHQTWTVSALSVIDNIPGAK